MLYQTKPNILSYINKLRNSKMRQMIWPIKSTELAKFLPMAMLMLTILLNQNLVRGLKDSLIITMIRPEVISFIKLWGEIPFGIAFVLIYTKMCNIMTAEQAFRRILCFFLFFFAFFAFVIFPLRFHIHPDPLVIDHYVQLYPNIKWFIIMWGQWSVVIFYIMGELWPVIVFSLLFWQLANKITKVEESARFYPFLSLFGQTNLLLSGLTLKYFTSDFHFLRPIFNYLQDETEISLKSVICVVIFSGIIGLILHIYIDSQIVSHSKSKISKKHLDLGFWDSIKLVLSSRYLGLICLLLVGYGVSINIIEGLWVSKIREMHSSPSEFMSFQGMLMFWTGIFTLFCTITGSNIIRHFGWFWGAVITPVVIMLTGSAFFLSVIFENNLDLITPVNSIMTPIAIIVFIGAIQNIFSKGTKYSLFDATKEMVYIPLDDETKTKGKAAVEIVGAKSGKAISAIISFISFTVFPNAIYQDIAPVLLVFFAIFCVAWIYAVNNLSKHYNLRISHNSQE